MKFKIRHMKKLLFFTLIILSVILFTGCKKKCNCGVITNDNIEFDSNGNSFYTLTITNDCTNNSGKFYFDYTTWLDANIGENFCVTSVSSWMAPSGETTVLKVENKESK